MALLAKVGSFNTGTGAAASNVVVTGVGFQPAVAIFWWSGRTGTSDASGGASIQRGIGFAISSSSRRCVFTRSEDAQTSSDASRAIYDTACIGLMITTGATIDGLLDFVSFDADGFTLVVDDQFTASYRIHYLALGGADLTNVGMGQFTQAGGTGDEAYTGVGFQPDCVLFLSANTGTLNAPQGGSEMCFGAATGASNQALWYADAISASATMATNGYCRAGEVWCNSSTGTITSRASFVSMDADGFTLTFPETTGTIPIFYLALKGGRYHVGDLLTATDTNNFAESGLSVGTPVAAMFVSAGKTADTADTVSVHDRWSMGAATSSSEQAAMATFDENGTADSETATAVEHDAMYINLATDDTVQGLAHLVSMDSDGFTLVMDDADPAQNFLWYLGIGSNAGGGGTGRGRLVGGKLVGGNLTVRMP